MKKILILTLALTSLIPNHWQGHIQHKVVQVEAIESDFRFGFITDTHYKENFGNSEALVRATIERLDLPFFIHGGDAVSIASDTKEATIRDMKKTVDSFGKYKNRLLFAEGNHEVLVARNSPEDREKLRKIIYAYNEGVLGRVKGSDDYSYYYQDYHDKGVRFIILNSSDYKEKYRHEFSKEQIEWFHEALEVPEDWAVIVASHVQPFYFSISPNSSGTKLAYILEARKKEGLEVIGWFSGHHHEDRMNYNRPPNITFNIVEILNDDKSHWGDPKKTRNTISEQAFEVISVNRKTGIVDLTRIGAGEDRQFKYKNEKGWILVKNKWQYINPDTGDILTGWLKDGDKWYYLGVDGIMVTGWQYFNGYWFYLNSSGAMVTDKWISGKYYVGSDGAMLVSSWTPDGYYVNEKGEWVE